MVAFGREMKDIKTQGIVLRRTNYGEADRILNIITPVGKIGVMARGVRKPKSKLAGGVEMFTLADLQIHQGKSELGVLTSARMVRHFGEIVKNYELMQVAGTMLKRVSVASESVDSEEYYEITKNVLEGLNDGMDVRLVETWFVLNLRKVGGEELNVHRDASGEMLAAGEKYDWNNVDEVFVRHDNGEYGESEIKLLRLMSRVDLRSIGRVKIEHGIISRVYDIIKIWEK